MIQKTVSHKGLTAPTAVHRVESMMIRRFPVGSRNCILIVKVYADQATLDAGVDAFHEYQHEIDDAHFDAVFDSELALSGFAQADTILLSGPLAGGTRL